LVKNILDFVEIALYVELPVKDSRSLRGVRGDKWLAPRLPRLGRIDKVRRKCTLFQDPLPAVIENRRTPRGWAEFADPERR